MKIYDGRDEKGALVYFEVPNHFLSRIAACKLVAAIPGANVTFRQRPFTVFGEEIFCKFELGGKSFELWEPFGDNSRFHVAATPLTACTELETLRKAFEAHRPVIGVLPWVVLVAGSGFATYSALASRCFSACK
jgi:hypothetical protein